MKLSDYVMSFLNEKGVDTLFYLPGGGCMHLLDSMAKNNKIKSISLLHEQAVAVACESYANTNGRTGVALVTTGPGATNTVTGMLAAYLDSQAGTYPLHTTQKLVCDTLERFHSKQNEPDYPDNFSYFKKLAAPQLRGRQSYSFS
jgi:hypothetical protein